MARFVAAESLRKSAWIPYPSAMGTRRYACWCGLALLLLLLVGVQWAIGWPRLVAPWLTIPPLTLLLAALLTLVSYAVRALRLYDYFLPDTRGGFTACLKLTLLHNVFNNLLPMRAGEASFPVLMRRYFATSLTRSLAALLCFRVLDLSALGILALASVGGHRRNAGLLALLAVTGLALPWLLFRLQSAAWLMQLGRRLPARWQQRLAPARDGLPRTSTAYWRAWLWTLVNWLVKLVVFAGILQLFAPMPAAAAFLGAIGGDLTSVLPVHGIAGAGTYEAGVVAALLPFGVPAGEALAAAVNLHLFMLGLSLSSGAFALLLRHDLPASAVLENHG
ncbi:MAG TPA: lysylphosphatidylglycerol synthase transmembrane domain-containing protein [Candidatus Accumulibacter phosphatis]|nr:lysylphosphatidylglycerol synthase transmembrane domain-containing protein [Candidatus Accumulibacter phosphatis]HRQ95065.1 lysylphosphatidylglycerol synthase transmembrane domain-containing protein [Candidatus Accumulibacter phosphatis]